MCLVQLELKCKVLLCKMLILWMVNNMVSLYTLCINIVTLTWWVADKLTPDKRNITWKYCK